MELRIKQIAGAILVLFSLALSGQLYAEDNTSDPNNQGQNRHGKPTVIVHQDTDLKTLPLNHLRAIFMLRVKHWPDGTPIKVFVFPDRNALHNKFVRETLKILPHQLRRQWDRYIYSGTGQGPNEVKSEQEMLERIQSSPGAIGYSRAGVTNDQVQTIQLR